MQIVKNCTTLDQATRHQSKLYQHWDSVRLVSAPVFSEQGRYVWAVAGKVKA
jgi:hypothetical protein